jgi:hypothetical protein
MPVGGITRACSRRSRLSRRLLAQAPRQPSSLLKHVVMRTDTGCPGVQMRHVLITALLLVLASVAAAGESWIAVGGGSSSYSLGDLTDGTASYRGFTPQSGRLESGNLFRAAAGVAFGKSWSAGFVYDRCSASVSGRSENYRAEAQVPLDILKVAGERFLYCRGPFRVGVGAGFGVAHLAASADFTNAAGYTRNESADAVTAMLDAQLTLDWSVLDKLAVVAALGARHAKFNELKVGYAPLRRDSDGTVVEADYSGWFLLAGLKWQLPTSKAGI